MPCLLIKMNGFGIKARHLSICTYDEKFAVQSILSSAYIIGMKGAGGARSAGRWGTGGYFVWREDWGMWRGGC